MSESSRALADIQTTLVKEESPEVAIRLVGKLGYDETLEKSLTARFPARIDELFVNFTGAQVRAGDPLAKVYSPELRTAQRELLNAYRADPESIYTVAARKKLLLWDLLPEQIDAILEDGEAQDHFTIKAPVGGVVVAKNVSEGDYLKAGEVLFRIVDLSNMWAELDAYESDLAWLQVGQSAALSLKAFPGEIVEGDVAFIEPEINALTRTVPVRVNVPNSEARLKPGMFVQAVVTGFNESSDVPTLVPSTAVLRTGQRAVVYVEKPDADRPTYEGREIELGVRAGDSYVVTSGLEGGERVVTNGAFKIDSALQIKAKPSMMNPDAGSGKVGHDHSEMAMASAPLELPVEMALSLLDDYLKLQASLASDDLGASKSALKAMMQVTGHQGDLPDLIHEMLAADSLDAIRRPHFETLSNSLVEAVMDTPSSFPEGLLVMHCPMVYDDRGADWIQAAEPLQNPYYGAMMLKCGEIKTKVGSLKGAEIEAATATNSEELFVSLVPGYLKLQAALAADDLDASKVALKSMMQATGHEGDIPDLIHAMLAADSLDTIRRPHFETLSNALIEAVESNPNSFETDLYLMHCPMVYGDRGASWLQAEDSLLNPYFGAMMLRCGESKGLINKQ
jgi:Cu(I)/Ag(I) efflux system membrane fusion protein